MDKGRIFDWYVQNPGNYTQEEYLSEKCGCITVGDDTTGNTDSYLYNLNQNYSNSIGNTFSAIFALTTDSGHATMFVDDGKYRVSISVGSTGVQVGEDFIQMDTSVFNDYLITIQGDEYRLYINNKKVFSGVPSTPSINPENNIGFSDYESGNSKLYIRIVRCTSGFRFPIDFDNLEFEVQVDTVDTFDSPNLRTYTNSGTVVTCKEDPTVKSVASGSRLCRSFRIPTIPRQPDMPYFFFYRVRITGNYPSDWAYFMFDEPETPYLYDNLEVMGDIRGLQDGMIGFCIQNRSSYMFLKGTELIPDGENIIACDLSSGVWKKVINSYFMLDADLTDAIFSHMYNSRLPGGNVYTRYNNSGNIATILKTESKLTDLIIFDIIKAIRDSRIYTASDSVLQNNFGSKYNLSKDYFMGPLEYRYALLEIDSAYRNPGTKSGIKRIFKSIFGVDPIIKEYRHVPGWIIWGDYDTPPENLEFVLSDDNELYPTYNEIVLYSEEDTAFGFDISVYNPYDISVSEKLVTEIVSDFKPVCSSENIIMHDKYGLEFQYPAYYYFSNFGRGLYYPKDTVIYE